MQLPAYLDLTARFRAERGRNVWSILIASFGTLNRIIEGKSRPSLAALVRDRVAPAFAELGWTARPGEDELTRQLRGDLVRALAVLGDHRGVQRRAAARSAREAGAAAPNAPPALIALR